MASLQELNSYQGNAGIGAGSAAGSGYAALGDPQLQLDAVDKLTAYTLQANRDSWAESNLLMQQQATEAAKNLAVTYGNLTPEDREVVDGNVSALYKYYQDHPNAVRFAVNPTTGETNAKEYGEFMQLRQQLDHSIVRGNLRANQAVAIEGNIAGIKDDTKRGKAQAFYAGERKKPITENMLIPPDTDPFQYNKYIESIAPNGVRSFDYFQKGPNNDLTISKTVFDPWAAASHVMNDLYSVDGNEDLKQSVGHFKALFNTMIDKYRVNGKLDMAKMQADPNAAPLLDQIHVYNQQIDTINSADAVEGGVKTNKLLYQQMGYQAPLGKIDLDKGLSDMDIVRASLAYKMGVGTKIKSELTDNQIQEEQMAVTRRGQDIERAKGKEEQTAVADDLIGQWMNLVMAPQAGGGQPSAIYTTPWKEVLNPDGKTYHKEYGERVKVTDYGVEVPVTPLLKNAFAEPVGKKVTTNKDVDPVSGTVDGQAPASDAQAASWGGGAKDFAQTTETTTMRYPVRMWVVADPKGNANKNAVSVQYDDGTTKDMSTVQAWGAMSGAYGDKVKLKAAQFKSARLRELGMNVPDVHRLIQKGYSIEQSNAVPSKEAPKAAKPAGWGGSWDGI